MANTRGSSPYSTYKTDRIQLIGNPENRLLPSSGTFAQTDQQFVNFYPTVIDSPINGSKRYRLEQRGGLLYNLSLPSPSGVARGIYYYAGAVFSVIGSTLYKNSTAIQTLSNSSGTVGFIEYSSITNKYLVVLDGISGWTINFTTSAVVQITDVDFPTPHIVQGSYMDGYLFVAKASTDDIYNCVLNDPFTWNAGDFLSAEMYPDNIAALTRQNNYIVAMGEKSIEYFYDSGVSPGTPLARNTAGAHQIGIAGPATMVQTEEQIIFVGQTGVGGRTIWVMDGFQPTEIGIDPVKKALNSDGAAWPSGLAGQGVGSATAYVIRSGGHRFYVLNLRSVQVGTGITWVYDFDTKMWHNWSQSANSANTSRMPFLYSSNYDQLGNALMLHDTSGDVYLLVYGKGYDESTSARTQVPITSVAISAKLDFGNNNRKFMSRFSLVCDIPNTGANPAATCTISWSDNDYQSFSSSRTITLDNTGTYTTQLGSFRRRAFKIVYADLYPFFLEGFEVDTNMGSQ